MTGNQARRILAALFAGAVLVLSMAHGAGERRPGPQQLKMTPRTDAGQWSGTWVYKSRNQRIVLWLREDESGKPEYSLQYQSLSSPEAFVTGWDGRAEYAVTGTEALFDLDATERDANTIRGTLKWDLQFKKSGRLKTGTFEMYRGGDGRHLVLSFPKQSLTLRRGDKVASEESNSAWTFIKYSRRLVIWEEVF